MQEGARWVRYYDSLGIKAECNLSAQICKRWTLFRLNLHSAFFIIDQCIMQGWLKSTRNSNLNTGSVARNHIWMCGVLKKSTFAYLKFHICIPTSAYYCIFWSFDCSVHVTSIPFAHLLNVWLYHHFTSRICRMDAPQQDYWLQYFSDPDVLCSCYHRPYRPCPNFSVPTSVKAKSSLVYNVFHQIGKIRTSGILRKGYEFWQGL